MFGKSIWLPLVIVLIYPSAYLVRQSPGYRIEFEWQELPDVECEVFLYVVYPTLVP